MWVERTVLGLAMASAVTLPVRFHYPFKTSGV